MVSLGKKVEGRVVETNIDGNNYKLTCKATGQMFNNSPQLAWFNENGEQAYRSINGKITFIEPTDKPESNEDLEVELPKVSDDIQKKFDTCQQLENYAYNLAYNIEARRQPQKVKMDIFGAIVSSTKDSLLGIYSSL